MPVSNVEIMVEEPSMEEALLSLLPRLLGGIRFHIHRFRSKTDLLNNLPNRLRAYSSWLPDGWRIVVVVDRDDDDCQQLKSRLEQIATGAGLRTRTASGPACQVVNRLAIEELEAWHFGDWDAVRAAYPRVPDSIPMKASYRNPDAIAGGTWEAFERVLKKAGYFRTGLRKIEAAKAIASHWNPNSNRSHSFGVFRDAIREMAT
ncbi:MAG: DUF4276 family protein [Phycisphaerae bacterium]|nr:DUF4276 family protein [Phycisphaerae bacterium]